MKRVFSKTADVCLAWAAGTHNDNEGARTGSNTWTKRGQLFSYSTCIAAIHAIPGVPVVAMVTHRQFSSGTSKVQGEAEREARLMGLPVFSVLHARPDGFTPDGWHQLNLRDYEQRIRQTIGRIAGCRSFSAGSIRREAIALIGEAHLYATTFGVSWEYRGANPLGLTAKSEMKEAA